MYDPTITLSKSILNYVPGTTSICGSHFSWACGQHNALPLLIKYIYVRDMLCYVMVGIRDCYCHQSRLTRE